MGEQERTEKNKTPSPDMAADPTANMMRALSDYFLKDKATEFTAGLSSGSPRSKTLSVKSRLK